MGGLVSTFSEWIRFALDLMQIAVIIALRPVIVVNYRRYKQHLKDIKTSGDAATAKQIRELNAKLERGGDGVPQISDS